MRYFFSRIGAAVACCRGTVNRILYFALHRLRSVLHCRGAGPGTRSRDVGIDFRHIRTNLCPSVPNLHSPPFRFDPPVCRSLNCRLCGVLNTAVPGFIPLALLCGVPELSLQLFRSNNEAALKQFLRRGLNLFLCTV